MFGNIQIDKLRFSVRLNNSFDPSEALKQLNNVMSKHFRDNNYSVCYDKIYFRLTFTPTLYLDNVLTIEEKPLLNLEMISEEKLLTLLNQIYQVLGDEAVVTWIDLTKNIPTEHLALKYINAISKRQFKYPYKKNDCTSQCNNTTLYLSSLKRKDDIDSINTNRQICFYAKVEEVQSKTRAPFIDDICLSDEEVAQIPTTNYQPETGRLFLQDLNILRCEQRYKFTNNIKRITHYVSGSKDNDKLTLPILIKLLEQGTLYQKLDEFYTNELRQYVFFDDIEEEKGIKLNKHEEMIKNMLLENDGIDINTFQYLFEEIGYKEQFKRSTKKILYNTIGQYYRELYIKLGIQRPKVAPELISEEK